MRELKMELSVRDIVEVYLNGDPKLAGKFRAYHISIDAVMNHWNVISEVWDDAQKDDEKYLLWIEDLPYGQFRVIDFWNAEDTSLSSISERLLRLVDWEAEYATRSAKGDKWGGWTVRVINKDELYKMFISSLLENGLDAQINCLRVVFKGLRDEQPFIRRRVVWNPKETRLEFGNSSKEGEEITVVLAGRDLSEEEFITALVDGFWSKAKSLD